LETPGTIFDDQGRILDHGLTAPLLLTGAVLTFYAFIGFEDMLNIAEEVQEPRRTMPRGIVIAQCMAALLYIGVAITAVSVVDYRELASPGAPLSKIANRAAPWLPSQTYVFITLFAVANTMLINYVMGSRLLYGMARQGLVPATLGRIHATRKTPHIAIITLLAIVAGLSYLGDLIGLVEEHSSGWLQSTAENLMRPDPISNLASATSLLLLFSFMVVNGGLIRLKLRSDEPKGGFEVPIVVPLLGMLINAALIGSRLMDPGAGLLAPMIAAVMVAGISVLYLVFRPKNVSEESLAAAESES
jgi:amino acid transporter